MPIAAEVYAVLFDNKSPAEATASLMMRPPRDERQGLAPAPGADSDGS